ncbi:maleylpyruvate isomerase N-terminal domain-containing protein [Streptomyces sp. RB6PN25]|uniref:Maleylpyruvate isomerase N-terminal domain-containing protein n=1 Tax=Streptomyces humicola TaxID=2953240 RepID=A0ABT1PSQ8_9ACTN|nr:maleylpyruvate isomerase N-terminal domain-containing protein [Streptomyces humicola]MCQ4080712.1 maleylpyruvate isomerase N-terminal domain-containing protein [Streptomyces humicola]
MGNEPLGDGDTPPHGMPLPRVPQPRDAADDMPSMPESQPVPALEPELEPQPRLVADPALPAYHFDHDTLKSLLGAWALSACSAEESAAVEDHLTHCASCAEEALRLRDAVGLLHREDSLDLDPLLRARVLEGCLGRRPARIPVPEWAGPYDAETARLDAFLGDLGDPEWEMPVRLTWSGGQRQLTLSGVLAHLGSIDGLVAMAIGLDDPLGPDAPRTIAGRTDEAADRCGHHSHALIRSSWRAQTRGIVRTLSFAGTSSGGLPVDFTGLVLPIRDALIDRAFECWIHAEDVATALDYPYEPPAPRHLNRIIDLAARQLPAVLAERRRAGLASSPGWLTEAGTPGRTLHLEVEGQGGGHWYIPLDSPAAIASPDTEVAHVALEGIEFCQLAAGHRHPEDLAAGQDGEREAIRDVLCATASMSRM